MMKPTFTIVEFPNSDSVCPGYALFSKDDYSVVLIGNRDLRRHPDKFMEAWDKVKEEIYEVYGWQPIGEASIRWVTKKRGHVSFYVNDELIGDMEQDDEGTILGSLDYRAPREVSANGQHPFYALPPHWEDFGASLLA